MIDNFREMTDNFSRLIDKLVTMTDNLYREILGSELMLLASFNMIEVFVCSA